MARPTRWMIFLALALSVAAVAARLFDVGQPFIGPWSWRQSDVAAIARNFFENGFHFARPQIDWVGSARGYVGTEFPILPFAVALIYKIAGVREWIGRGETILFFVLSLTFFYSLVRRVFGQSAALWALFFYGFAPLNIAAGRVFMPDVPSLSLSIAGVYFFWRWLDSDNWSELFLAAFSLALAILIKAPTAIIGVPMFYLAWRRFGWPLLREFRLWLFGAVVLLPSAVWYWHAHLVAAEFYPHHFFGAGGFEIMPLRWYAGILWRTATVSLTPVLFALGLAGIFVRPAGQHARFFHWWLGTMLLFMVVLGYGNRHPWYQLPLVPIMAALAGAACQNIFNKLGAASLVRGLVAGLVALLFAGSSFAYVRSYFAPASVDLYDVGLRLKEITEPSALIIAADDGDPTIFYYAHRKGWHFLEKEGIWQGPPLTSAAAIDDLENLRDRGADYIAFPFRTRWWLDYYKDFAMHLRQTAEPVEVTPRFAIYRLKRFREKNEITREH